jgi:hypothetical protein
MPTQLNETWLPGREPEINTDMLGGLTKTATISKEVKRILDDLEGRKFRWLQNITIIKVLKDSHSKLTSDDLLWYTRTMDEKDTEDQQFLREIKIKDTSLVMPRALSHKIKALIESPLYTTYEEYLRNR